MRFQYKEEVVAVVKELGAIPHYEVMVPTKDHKQRGKGQNSDQKDQTSDSKN